MSLPTDCHAPKPSSKNRCIYTYRVPPRGLAQRINTSSEEGTTMPRPTRSTTPASGTIATLAAPETRIHGERAPLGHMAPARPRHERDEQ